MWPTWSARPEDGASAVEFGLVLAGVLATILVIVGALAGVPLGRLTHGCTTHDSAVRTSQSC